MKSQIVTPIKFFPLCFPCYFTINDYLQPIIITSCLVEEMLEQSILRRDNIMRQIIVINSSIFYMKFWSLSSELCTHFCYIVYELVHPIFFLISLLKNLLRHFFRVSVMFDGDENIMKIVLVWDKIIYQIRQYYHSYLWSWNPFNITDKKDHMNLR